MVVAQLAERLLPTSEIRGSNPNNGKNYPLHLSVNILSQMKLKKNENKEKEKETGKIKNKVGL